MFPPLYSQMLYCKNLWLPDCKGSFSFFKIINDQFILFLIIPWWGEGAVSSKIPGLIVFLAVSRHFKAPWEDFPALPRDFEYVSNKPFQALLVCTRGVICLHTYTKFWVSSEGGYNIFFLVCSFMNMWSHVSTITSSYRMVSSAQIHPQATPV